MYILGFRGPQFVRPTRPRVRPVARANHAGRTVRAMKKGSVDFPRLWLERGGGEALPGQTALEREAACTEQRRG